MTEILAGISPETLRARTLEALAQSVARERGLVAVKSDTNGFKLIDLKTREIVAGHFYELSALDVLGLVTATNKSVK
jgi:hypothetical protein